jgi:cation diffusion facilitator family transporter
MDDSSIKTRVAILSVVSNTFLILLKAIAGILSGSVSIISEAIHSGMDLIAAVIAFFSVRISAKPADRDHPYGHGKVENVSGVVEGLLILVAAVIIIWEAIKKIINPTHIGETNIALVVMFISAAVNFFVSGKLYKVAKQVDSVALEADALHLKTDIYTSLGVGIGIVLIKFTGKAILDPIVAILVALLILKEAISLIWNAYCPLLDTKLSDSDEEKIKSIINCYKNEIIDFHALRTRKSGSIKYIDFHMTVNKDLSVEQSHELSDRIESDLEDVLKNTNVSIHIEPGV